MSRTEPAELIERLQDGKTLERVLFAFDSLKGTLLGSRLLVTQLVSKRRAPQVGKVASQEEILKVLERMNINQMRKLVPGIFKGKYYCCLSHHTYRKSFEDPAWLQVEAACQDQMLRVDALDSAAKHILAAEVLVKLLKEDLL